MSNFVSAEELKKRKAAALKAQADQAATEEAAQKAQAQVEYEARLPIVTDELRPYIRKVIQRAIKLAMDVKEGHWRWLLIDSEKLVKLEAENVYSNLRDENYGQEFSTVGCNNDYESRHYVHLKLNMSRVHSTDPLPWGEEPAAVGAWEAVSAELAAELQPLGYTLVFKRVDGFTHTYSVADDFSTQSETYFSGYGCTLFVSW